MKKQKLKKKVFTILIIIVILGIAFFIGMQFGISSANNEEGTTTTTISEVEVETQTIQKKLTSSGQISSASSEKLSLSTSKYFQNMCVETDDIVAEGENILEYTDGTYLKAEYNCIVTDYNLPETESICTSENYIEVENLDDLVMTLSINESEINSVEVGQEVNITLTADDSKTYSGQISKIDSIGTYSSSGSTFTATVSFQNDGDIKIGMTASCEVILEEATDVIAVPVACVQISDESRYVIVAKEDGTTENVEVETGISDGDYVEITSGLTGGEKIQLIETTTVNNKSSSSQENSRGEGRGDFMGGQDVRQGGSMSSGMPDSRGRQMQTPHDTQN